MSSAVRLFVGWLVFAPSLFAQAASPNFSGTWTIDLRSPEERQRKIECGSATFVLKQNGDNITGDHSMATPGCGRVNEGREGSVKGDAVGADAVLVVTSGRNGAIVFGTASLRNGVLIWRVREEIRAGEPAGDSPLILSRGSLRPMGTGSAR